MKEFFIEARRIIPQAIRDLATDVLPKSALQVIAFRHWNMNVASGEGLAGAPFIAILDFFGAKPLMDRIINGPNPRDAFRELDLIRGKFVDAELEMAKSALTAINPVLFTAIINTDWDPRIKMAAIGGLALGNLVVTSIFRERLDRNVSAIALDNNKILADEGQ